MSIVTGSFENPGGEAAEGTVTFQLVGEGGKALRQAWRLDTDSAIVGTHTVALINGGYSVGLSPNDQLVPAGTRWLRTVSADGAVGAYLLVDGIGGDEEGLLADPPGAIATAALDVHVLTGSHDSLAVGGPVTLGSEDRPFDALFAFEEAVTVGVGAMFTVTGGGAYRGILFAPTIVYDGPSPFTGGRSIEASSVLKNPAGVVSNMPHQTGFYAAEIVRGDGAAFTTDRTAFLDPGSYDTINGGSVIANSHQSFVSAAALGAGVAMGTRRGSQVLDAVGAGTLTTQVAVDIPLLLKATTNIGIRNAAPWVAPPRIGILAGASAAIGVDAQLKRLDNTSGGPLTLTSTPTIADAQDGTILMMFNGSADAVTLQDGPTFNLRLGAATRQLDQGDALILMFSATLGDWIELMFAGSN